MRTLEEINELLRKGDQRLISELVGCTSDYVGMVLRGERKSEKIIQVANEVIDNRDNLFLKHKN